MGRGPRGHGLESGEGIGEDYVFSRGVGSLVCDRPRHENTLSFSLIQSWLDRRTLYLSVPDYSRLHRRPLL